MSLTFRITPAAPDMVRANLDVVEQRLMDFWAHTPQARMLCHVHPVSFTERLSLLPKNSEDWRRPYLLEQRAHYAALEVLVLDTYLVLWPEAGTNEAVLESTLPDALQVPSVTKVQFPELVAGSYRPHATYLEPLRAGMPYLAVLTAYDVRGGWAPVDVGTYSGWHRLLSLSVPLTLAIDVQTLESFTAASKLTWALERRLSPEQRASAEYLQSVLDTEAVHLLRYAVLLQARTPDDLARCEQQVQHVMGRRLQLERLPGAQAQHIRFFQDVPPRAIQTPTPARNTSSHGVASKAPFAVRRSVSQHGVLLGTDTAEKTPVHYELFGADGRQNANAIVLGTSGAGKTVAMQTWAVRLALQGAQVVLMEPARTCYRLRDAIADRRACAYHEVAETPAVNILDPHATSAVDQRDSIIRKLEVVLGKPIDAGGRIRVEPRELTNAERGAINLAMQHERLYGPGCLRLATMDAATAPLLEDLIAVLRRLEGRAEAHRLAQELEDTLLGTAAPIFNAHTALPFDPRADVVLYSFRGVKPERLPLLYDYLFDTIDSWVWSPQRDTARPLLLFIDEFFYMASVQSLEQRVVKATKTWRNSRAGLISADQNAETYYGKTGADFGPFVTDNTRQKFFFQLETGAAILEEAYADKLTPSHGQALRALRRGQCLAMLDGEVRTLQVELTPLESRGLLQ